MDFLPNIGTVLTSSTENINSIIVYFNPIIVYSFIFAIITGIIYWLLNFIDNFKQKEKTETWTTNESKKP